MRKKGGRKWWNLGTLLLLLPIILWFNRRLKIRNLKTRFEQEIGTSPRIPILMPICGRLSFLNETLQALNNRVAGIESTVLIISDDCWKRYQKETDHLIASLPSPVRLRIFKIKHSKPYGGIPTIFLRHNEYATSANIYDLLEFAFDILEVEAAIVLESDLVPTADFLNYFKWMFDLFFSSSSVNASKILSVSGYQNTRLKDLQSLDPKTLGAFHLRKCVFIGWSWLTSKSAWSLLVKPNWTLFGGWDLVLEAARKSLNLDCYCPVQSRVKNIGYEGENFKMTRSSYEASEFNSLYINNTQVRSYDNMAPAFIE